jgi:hypothetical protein
MGAAAIHPALGSIAPEQCAAVASAIANVQALYPTKYNAKAIAWAHLAMVAGAVYGPVVMQIIKDKRVAPPEQRQMFG